MIVDHVYIAVMRIRNSFLCSAIKEKGIKFGGCLLSAFSDVQRKRGIKEFFKRLSSLP